MIKLKIEEYCNNCPDFEPEVEKDVAKIAEPSESYHTGPKVRVTTNIYCKRRLCCRCLRDSIKKHVDEAKSGD